MIDIRKLKGKIAEKGYSQRDMAKFINKTPKTFYLKMKTGVFDSNEIELIVEALGIENPAEIFFAKEVTQ